MFDHVVILDEPLACPVGHSLAGLQTKSFADPSMSTYLIRQGRVFRTVRGSWSDDDEDARSAWRILKGDGAASHETLYRLDPVVPPRDLSTYTHCAHCEPVLVRSDGASLWGDVVHEHRLFVEFALSFTESEPMRVERITGGREELADELRRSGLRVLEDDAPLAVAHREIQRARQGSTLASRARSKRRRL
jgi:hypothetical protein